MNKTDSGAWKPLLLIPLFLLCQGVPWALDHMQGLINGIVIIGAVVIGIVMLAALLKPSSGRQDVSVNNDIVGRDGKGRYLVKARTSWNITGPHRSSQNNLPGHVIQVGKNLWVVDQSKSVFTPEQAREIKFEPVFGWHIQPRGQDQPVADLMAGFHHEYVQPNDEAAG